MNIGAGYGIEIPGEIDILWQWESYSTGKENIRWHR